MFQPGQSGNPSGKAKQKPISDALRSLLSRHASDTLDDSCITVAHRIALALVNNAVRGDLQSSREIADRVEGKPETTIAVKDTPLDNFSTEELIALRKLIQSANNEIPAGVGLGAGETEVRSIPPLH